MTDQRERLSTVNIRRFRADANLMTDKPFSRKKTRISHNHRFLGVSSRENAEIFLRSDALRERSIARSIGRARIETSSIRRTRSGKPVSPDQLVGRGLKRLEDDACLAKTVYRPINWSGAD